MGMIDFILGKIHWLDNETVQVIHKNGLDYWVKWTNSRC